MVIAMCEEVEGGWDGALAFLLCYCQGHASPVGNARVWSLFHHFLVKFWSIFGIILAVVPLS